MAANANEAMVPFNAVLNMSSCNAELRNQLAPGTQALKDAKIPIAVRMLQDKTATNTRNIRDLSTTIRFVDTDVSFVDGRVDALQERMERGDVRTRRLEERVADVQLTTALTDEAAARDVANLREQVDQQGYLVNGHEHRLMSTGDLAASKISALKAKAAATDVVANAAVHMAVNLQQEMQSTQQEVQHIKNDIVKVPRLEKQIKLDRKAYAEQAAHIQQLEKDKEDQKKIINELTLTVNDLKQNQVQLYAMMAANVQMLGERVGKMEQQIMHGTIIGPFLGPFPVASSSSAASCDTVLDFGLGNS